mgnify:CR=1 FL=1
MSVATIEVELSPNLVGKLNRIAQVLGGNESTAALMAGAQLVVNAAQAKAPVLTGTLRRSIRAEAIGNDVVVGTDLPYARRIEFGFNGADSRGRVYHQAAKPYLRPALDENRARVMEVAAKAAEDLLKRL